ncbi:MAG TPA: Mpo1-like protein [Paraburkholderia sp.]|uniref:Mpo1-like protein n=1 Tax=Paraburkholderia sp. TaxID=1926495 RepID=UPI002B4A75FC|nr:Mpo1-like protein [Paraburkholderia sp.]HKR38687.1 Mpo1-like protein [Paraburkholderia sp.]
MLLVQLVKRQWSDYPRTHRSRRNLLVHLAAVPAFVAANTALVAALLLANWTVAAVSLVIMAASLAWQGRCHREEPERPEPFSGPIEAVVRILIEQWVTFPRFAFSGCWARALRETPRQSASA